MVYAGYTEAPRKMSVLGWFVTSIVCGVVVVVVVAVATFITSKLIDDDYSFNCIPAQPTNNNDKHII